MCAGTHMWARGAGSLHISCGCEDTGNCLTIFYYLSWPRRQASETRLSAALPLAPLLSFGTTAAATFRVFAGNHFTERWEAESKSLYPAELLF